MKGRQGRTIVQTLYRLANDSSTLKTMKSYNIN